MRTTRTYTRTGRGTRSENINGSRKTFNTTNWSVRGRRKKVQSPINKSPIRNGKLVNEKNSRRGEKKRFRRFGHEYYLVRNPREKKTASRAYVFDEEFANYLRYAVRRKRREGKKTLQRFNYGVVIKVRTFRNADGQLNAEELLIIGGAFILILHNSRRFIEPGLWEKVNFEKRCFN